MRGLIIHETLYYMREGNILFTIVYSLPKLCFAYGSYSVPVY